MNGTLTSTYKRLLGDINQDIHHVYRKCLSIISTTKLKKINAFENYVFIMTFYCPSTSIVIDDIFLP